MTLLWAALGLAAVYAVLSVAPHLLARKDGAGCEGDGVVLFVESIRWLGIRWGMRTAAAGMRRAGFTGQFIYWRWHATWRGCLVLPAIVDRRLFEREARKLAEEITRRRREYPDRPIYLIGYSAGAFVAVRALEMLEADVRVDAAALLAPAISPWRPMGPACDRLKRPMVVCSSLCDCLIVGLGTLVFGTADRRHVPSLGMIGGRGAARDETRVQPIRWRPSLVRLGHWGGHFSASAAAFVQHCVAPAMGIASRPSSRLEPTEKTV